MGVCANSPGSTDFFNVNTLQPQTSSNQHFHKMFSGLLGIGQNMLLLCAEGGAEGRGCGTVLISF